MVILITGTHMELTLREKLPSVKLAIRLKLSVQTVIDQRIEISQWVVLYLLRI